MELKALDRAIGAPTRKTPLAHNQSVCVFIDDTGIPVLRHYHGGAQIISTKKIMLSVEK